MTKLPEIVKISIPMSALIEADNRGERKLQKKEQPERFKVTIDFGKQWEWDQEMEQFALFLLWKKRFQRKFYGLHRL